MGGERLRVAVADEPEERWKGLRQVEEVPWDGMLFVFPEPRAVAFTMMDTRVPLDIWFFDDSGALIGEGRMEPCPGPPCPDYASPGEVMWVLETPAGERVFPPGAVLTFPSGENP